MNEQGQDEIEFTSQILYYPQKIQKKKKQKKKKKETSIIIFYFTVFKIPERKNGGKEYTADLY